MTDVSHQTSAHKGTKARKRIKARYRAEWRFKYYGMSAIGLALASLAFLLINISAQGFSSFFQYQVTLDIVFDESIIDPEGVRNPDTLGSANYTKLARNALSNLFPEVSGRRDKRQLNKLLSGGARFQLRAMVLDDPSLIGQRRSVTFPLSDDGDSLLKGFIDRNIPDSDRRVSGLQIGWIDHLVEQGLINRHFNKTFFTAGDSREPELAGILGAIIGSGYTLLVTLLAAFPLGVATAIYLEEFAPKNRWTDLVEVNVNNLAAVPSIVFGLLGLAVFLNFFHLPRSAPLVGGLVLALMTLPTIIITSRAALKAVPPSIKEGALGVGASKNQTIFHHVLPLAMPGIMTGTIIGLARALGETAPLLMIGMVAFIVDIPSSPLSPSTALPVQVFIWADSPERAFVAMTSAAVIVLLGFLIVMNLTAVIVRSRFERRW